MFKLKKHNRSTGQALVEFALMAVVLLMIMFIIIEAARILWAWGTVQNAAREGARYAITGQYDWPDWAVSSLPKFNTPLLSTVSDAVGAKDLIQPGVNGAIFTAGSKESLAEAILEARRRKFDREAVAKSAPSWQFAAAKLISESKNALNR